MKNETTEIKHLQKDNPLKGINTKKVIWPIILGLGVVGFLLYREFRGKNFLTELSNSLVFNSYTLVFIIVAIVCMLMRDLGYILRIRVLSDYKLSWLQSFRIIMLWEFSSAITPSAVGGTAVATIFVNKEGINIGRSSAIVMATSFLDELYFVIMAPIIFFLVNPLDIFVFGASANIQGASFVNNFFWFAIIGYSIKLLYLLILSYGFFINPRGLKWVLLKIFKLRFLRRWKYGAHQAGTDIIYSSTEFKRKPFIFWIKTFLATFLSWTSRYWVVNAIFVAFSVVRLTGENHIVIFARQLVMWIMMLIMPTPGGSGASEYIFEEFFSDYLHSAGVAVILALVWRLTTYYPYLIAGAFIFPKWVKTKFGSDDDSKLIQVNK
jgi:uncharacterized protein (TIRG00374 family)